MHHNNANLLTRDKTWPTPSCVRVEFHGKSGRHAFRFASFLFSREEGIAFGGGTSNIGFNVGADGGQDGDALPEKNSGNANAVDVTAQYWVSQVRAKVELDPSMTVGQKVSPAALHQRHTVPEFFLDEGVPIPSSRKTVTIVYTQIQYSQLVFLDFNGLKWPHVTVATLAPIVHNKKPTLSSVIEKR